ncbi:MAG: tetratricopeptide repeat protein [Ignavibacteria bacterium]|nr:tetratricopeptide repeat protein [Ignavibacteria bacterium]
MSKSKRDLFEDKACLIYEFNKKSPLFVKQANKEILLNNIDSAIEILENGLRFFPSHFTAKIILARALALKGSYSNSLKIFKEVFQVINSTDSFNYYVHEIENIKKQRSAFEMNKRLSTWVDIPEEIEDSNKTDFQTKSNSVDDRLSEIAQKISSIKLSDSSRQNSNAKSDSNINTIKEKSITSETMAKIFIAQGEFKEAIKIYQKLSALKPDRKSYFDQKILELNKKLEL